MWIYLLGLGYDKIINKNISNKKGEKLDKWTEKKMTALFWGLNFLGIVLALLALLAGISLKQIGLFAIGYYALTLFLNGLLDPEAKNCISRYITPFVYKEKSYQRAKTLDESVELSEILRKEAAEEAVKMAEEIVMSGESFKEFGRDTVNLSDIRSYGVKCLFETASESALEEAVNRYNIRSKKTTLELRIKWRGDQRIGYKGFEFTNICRR